MKKANFDSILQGFVKFSNMRYMKIIMNGFMSVAAISISGSIFSLLASIPITPYQTFLTNSGLGDLLAIPIAACSDLMALFVVIGMAYTLAESFKVKPLAPALVAIGAFMILTPFTASQYVVGADGSYSVVSVTNALSTGSNGALGAKGIFLAILVGLSASRLYVFLIQKNIKIKMPDTVPPVVSGMFEQMIPGGIVYVLFLIIRWLVGLTSFGTVQNMIYTLIQAPFMNVGGGLGGAIVYLLLGQILWCFGIHGGLVAYSVFATVMSTAMAANASAFAAGTAATNIPWGVVTACQGVAWFGLSLMLILSKKKENRSLGILSMPTSLCNISEPLMFGLPIIMNPIMCIPFVLYPVVSLLLTTFVMNIGLVVPITGASISNVLPAPLYFGFMNAHWTGFVWGIVLWVLCFFL
ncbi:MAG: PTS transporter subunit EIIC [Lachnospiraceae bacterium]|nr:PTS transporter subunit EIIC [Lachnospiraceae bacterium]